MASFEKFVDLFKLGYFICDVPEEIMAFSREQTTKMISTNFEKKISFKNGLVGAIEHEYRFSAPVPALNVFFKKIIPEYWKNFEVVGSQNYKTKKTYHIPPSQNGYTHIWVNFQRKYEHNPLHMHSGELSFIYWVNIPYDLEKEKQLPHTMSSNQQSPPHTTLGFYYPSLSPSPSNITSHHIDIDKTFEGKMIIFPSWLQHNVTPFYTSEDYRISVAGNIYPVE